MYRVSAAFAAANAFDADFLSAAVRFDAGIESWEYGNTGAASFSRAADREGWTPAAAAQKKRQN